MTNPYIWKTTITNPECFFGRKEEVEDIYERINSEDPQSVAVVSERKMGKSSLLYYLYHKKEEYLRDPEKYVFISVDIQGETINSRDDFFKVILERLRENEKLRDRIVVDDKDNHENVKKTVSKLNADGYKLILFLDEFDLLVQKESIPPELYENLRALANSYAVAYITATVKSPTQLTKEHGSPFFNIFTGKNLGAFSKEEAMELIEGPSAREGVPLKNDAKFVFEIAGLHPYFIQIACSKLFKYKSEKEHLSKSDRDKICEEILEESTFQFEHIWKHLSKKEKEVLLKLAKSESTDSKEEYILKDLIRKGYVIKKGKGHIIFSSVFKVFVVQKREKPVDIDLEHQSMQNLSDTEVADEIKKMIRELENEIDEMGAKPDLQDLCERAEKLKNAFREDVNNLTTNIRVLDGIKKNDPGEQDPIFAARRRTTVNEIEKIKNDLDISKVKDFYKLKSDIKRNLGCVQHDEI